LGGDVIIADHQRTTIASADIIASEFAQHFHSRKLFFATNVNGVYKKFPTRNHESPLCLIQKKELQAMCVKNKTKKSSLDVTGSMIGKLHSLLPLRNCIVTIFNGLLSNTLEKVLHGEMLGTRITL
jgi:isopentenyl phosphate kinase